MENFKVLGLNENASRDEIESAYARLRNRYKEDRFLEGAAGNDAARKLTELDQAYSEIISSVSRQEAQQNYGNDLGEVDNIIRNGDYERAQSMLDGMSDRNAEWHYLQSIIYYKRNWYLESKKQLELAINADPNNDKYKTALSRLENVMASPIGPDTRNTQQQQQQGTAENGQAGNSNDCGNCCMSLCIADCCCNMMNCCG